MDRTQSAEGHWHRAARDAYGAGAAGAHNSVTRQFRQALTTGCKAQFERGRLFVGGARVRMS
eukprot:321489-Chlamydomonas_euryale.AAC.4